MILMKRIFQLLLLVAALQAPAYSDTVQVDVQRDGGYLDLQPDNNLGGHTHVPVGRSNNGAVRRSVFYFDVESQVPPGSTIESVQFVFDVGQQGGGNGHSGADFQLHRVTRAWTEGTGGSSNGEITGNGATWNSATGTIAWDTPGGDFSPVVLGTVYVDVTSPPETFSISSPQLVAEVQDMLDHPQTNFGFLLKANPETLFGSAARVTSREGAPFGPEDAARLIIDFVPPAAETTADSFTAFRGFHVAGTLEDTFVSDDAYLKYNPGLVLFPSEAPVWLIFDGTLPASDPTSLAVEIESRANTPGLTLTIEMFNWNTNQFAVVATSAASFNNDVTNAIDASSGIANFVQQGTGAVRTRFGWRASGVIFLFPWTVCVDRVVWISE
jgi:hypothetical protein